MTGIDQTPSPRRAFTDSVVLTGGHRPRAHEPRPPAGIEAVVEALEAGDAAAMLRAWHAACLDALGSQRWEPMIDVGDAAWRIGQATGFKIAFAVKARQAYHVALYRAHKQSSVEGVQRVGQAFQTLGDREAVQQCAAVAARLTERVDP
ncbi:MAG TPA: hypothetical protein VLF19_00920 [Methylomirabilota bacterium]|nr:hypothetical protein [Methylomirabilota bacterium]